MLDQAAAAELEQPRRSDPEVAVAVDQQRARRRRRHPGRAPDRAPVVALAVGDAVVGADQHVAARPDRHRARRAGRVEPGRQARLQVGRARRTDRQEPHVGRRPDPQRTLAIAQHALDAIAAQPGVAAEVVPHPVAAAELDGRAVAHDHAAGVGPQRAHRGGRGARPAGRRREPAVGVLDVQPAAVGADPQPAAVARHGLHRDRREPQRGRAREPRAVPAHQAVVAADADPAVGRDPDDVDQARRQAVVDREVGELLAVEAIHAVLGAEPQEAVAVLRDADHDEVAQPVGAVEHPERQLALRQVGRGVGAHRASRGEPAQRQRAAPDGPRHVRAGHSDDL